MVRHKMDSLSDLIRHGYWVKLKCQCGHEAKLDPVVLRTSLHKRDKSSHLNRLNEAMCCQQCGKSSFAVEPCYGPAVWS